MVRHVVMWNLLAFADGRAKAENLVMMKEALDVLPSEIEQIRTWEVGVNGLDQADGYDIVLIASFET